MTADALSSFVPVDKSNALYAGARSFALNTRGDFALLGGKDGKLGISSVSEKTISQEMEAGPGSVTDALWIGDRAAAATTAGNVKIWENGTEVATFSGHAGEVTALAIHPSSDILASVGLDKSYIFYDLTINRVATQVLTDAGKAKEIPTCFIPGTDNGQHLLLPLSTQTVICSLLVVWTVRSKYTMSRRVRTLQTLTLQGP